MVKRENCIIAGNPSDGFTVTGPFPDHDAAVRYGQRHFDVDWWVLIIHKPLL